MTNQDLAVRKNGNQSIDVTIADNMARLRELIVNGAKLTPEQIRGRADFAAQQHLDVISEVHTLVTKEGKTMAHTMSINGLRRKNQELMPPGDTIDVQFLEWPPERMKKEWAYAYDCYLRDGESYRQWQKRILEVGKVLKEVLGTVTYDVIVQACGPAPVVVGTGIVYLSELNEWKDRNFNPMERAKKRAEVNARHHRFPTNVPVYEGDNGAMEIVDGSAVEVSVRDIQPEAPRTENNILAKLGYDVTPEPETISVPVEEEKDDPEEMYPEQAPMTIEQASLATNSNGDTKLIDFSTKQLESMAEKLGKKDTRLPKEETELLAIQVIVKFCKAGQQAAAQERLI